MRAEGAGQVVIGHDMRDSSPTWPPRSPPG